MSVRLLRRPRRPLSHSSAPLIHQPRPFLRTLMPAPSKASDLLSRRSDRALPSLRPQNPFFIWRHVPLFLATLAVAAYGIFNYEKMNHSVIASSLYALRVHPVARDRLGGDVYFGARIPWISGSIDTVHGLVDVTFGVKGTRGKGTMRFRCTRAHRSQFFKTEIWTLTMADGEVINLMDEEVVDPMARSELPVEGVM